MPKSVLPWRAVSGVSGNGRIRSISCPGAKIAVEVERRGEHADDRDRLVVHRQRAADDGAIAVEPAPPEGMAEDGDARAVEAAFVGGEIASELERHAEHVEKIVRHADARSRSGSPEPVRVWRRTKSKKAK